MWHPLLPQCAYNAIKRCHFQKCALCFMTMHKEISMNSNRHVLYCIWISSTEIFTQVTTCNASLFLIFLKHSIYLIIYIFSSRKNCVKMYKFNLLQTIQTSLLSDSHTSWHDLVAFHQSSLDPSSEPFSWWDSAYQPTDSR